ncbi:hypothetical protein DEM26_18300 [Thioclava sp. NG1]|uniref:hypothetical protein n=1 Tax=Thioclava sp. NG1 TaxID=2182426 RepID=UPI000D60A081|nr:hypothetical protein [Thioclava sp. NG1]PWE48499.1 hypothetical protein DEM26_18300 [Thioclava sp. NG1]
MFNRVNEDGRREYVIGGQVWLGGHEYHPPQPWASGDVFFACLLVAIITGSIGFLIGLAV